MCLRKIDLNLKWNNKVKAFVGIGYKNLRPSDFEKYAKIGRWSKASGSLYNKKAKLKDIFEYADIGINKMYHPGFHIFLNKEDAKTYREYGEIYEVMFKNVISFGTNETFPGNNTVYKPCVVTEYMKIVKKAS